MAQHFLLSAAARSLSVAKVMRMPEPEVETVFRRLRWPGTDGEPVCPGCGCGLWCKCLIWLMLGYVAIVFHAARTASHISGAFLV